MSVNFNIALLRSLKTPLQDSLKKLNEQLQEVLEGKRDITAFAGVSEAHLVVGGLIMINAHGAALIARTIENLVGALQNTHDVRFQDLASLHTGARAAQQGIKALEGYLNDLGEGAEDQPVRLWTPWSTMIKVLGEDEPHAEALFFPTPNFDDEGFRPIEPSDLKMTVESLRRRFEEGANQWAAAETTPPAETGLRQILTVVGETLSLHHRKGYQGYWLALMARVQAALLHPDQERDDKRALGALLDQASVEFRKFAEDQKKVADDILRAMVMPLVNAQTLEWAVRYPMFSELDRRFGVRAFLQAVHRSTDVEGQAKTEAFAQRHQEIKDNVHQVKLEWAKQIAVPLGQSPLDKRNLLKTLTILLQKRDVFPGEASSPLLASLVQISEHYTTRLNDRVSEEVGSEVATLLVMLDAVIDKRGPMSPDFGQESDLQKRRVALALALKVEELASLPKAAWDQQTKAEQNRAATRLVIKEVQKDVLFIEHILNDVLLNKDDSHEGLARIDEHTKLAAGVLRMMGLLPAVRVLEGVREVAKNFGKKGYTISDRDREHVTVGIGALRMFLNAFEGGDPTASRFLNIGLKTLFNEDPSSDEPVLVPSPMVIHDPIDHREPFLAPAQPAQTPPSDTSDLPTPPSSSTVVPVEPLPIMPPVMEPTAPAPVIVEPVGRDLAGWDESFDLEIAEIFLEEADEALAEINAQLLILDRSPSDEEALTTVRRQFHTLKGSGRQAQFHRLGGIAWLIEERLHVLIADAEPTTPAFRHVMATASSVIGGLIATLSADYARTDRDPSAPLRVWVDSTEVVELLDDEHTAHPSEEHRDVGPDFHANVEEPLPVDVPQDEGDDLDRLLNEPNAPDHTPAEPTALPSIPVHEDASPAEPTIAPPTIVEETHETHDDLDDLLNEPAASAAPALVDPERLVWIGETSLSQRLFDLFAEDANHHLNLLHGAVSVWYLEVEGWKMDATMVRSAHTLRSLGKTVHFPALAELAGALEARTNQSLEQGEKLEVPTLELIEDTVEALKAMVASIVTAKAEPAPRDDLIEALNKDVLPAPAVAEEDLDHDFDHPLPDAPDASDVGDEPHHDAMGESLPHVAEPEAVPHVEHEAVLPVAEVVTPARVSSGIDLSKADDASSPVTTPKPVDGNEGTAETPSKDIAEITDPWDDVLDALSVMGTQVHRLAAAFEALALRQR